MTAEQVAWGIHQIVNENMANAARAHLGERGKDPRRMPMYAFGGAGPVHGYRVAEILRLPALISPFGAGVGSTFGLLSAPLAFDFVRSAYSRMDELDWNFANRLLDEHGSRRASGFGKFRFRFAARFATSAQPTCAISVKVMRFRWRCPMACSLPAI